MRKVYVCSPLRAATPEEQEKNRLSAIGYCEMVSAMFEDVKAVAPHGYFPLLLDDSIPQERVLALDFGLKLLELCKALFVCGTYISIGMKGEILCASELGIPIYVQELPRLGDVTDLVCEHNGTSQIKSFYEALYEGARK